jgi:hypothetical protein
MSQSNIEKGLRTAFKAALPDSEGKTAFENQPFEPEGKSKWYIFSYIPNMPEVATLGKVGQDSVDGICQIDINIPAGRGKEGVDADVDMLRAVFTAGARILCGSTNIVIKSCGRSGIGRKVNGFFRFTVTIAWETRLTRSLVPIEVIHAIGSEEDDVVSW